MAKSAATFESIISDIRAQRFAPVYFLFGDEPFLIEEIEREISATAVEASARDFNSDLVYGGESDARTVLSLCGSYPVMAPRRVVVVRDFEKLADNRQFQAYAENPNPTCITVLVCSSKPNLTNHPYRALKQHAVSFESKKLRDYELPRWIEQRLRQTGYQAEPEAVQMVADFVGTDLRAVTIEIDKIQTYIGERGRITADDVVLAGGQTRDVSVFELQRAVGQGRYIDAVRTGERLLQQASNANSECLIIITILSAFFLKLWRLTPVIGQRLQDRELASHIGVNPFFVKEYRSAHARFGPRGIGLALSALLAADFTIKGGASHDPRSTLVLLLRRLMPAV
jgi:DNA polymerase III subunit delta